ncbi:MAG: class I SAM-dependent methyltransferase [Candidatus Omnitrophica bacterium]|nr:class I SAM-dependent methyltransferase [Candidatus Omnitrophota bacterium]
MDSILTKNKEFYNKKWSGISLFIRRLLVYECKEKIASVKKLMKITYHNRQIKGKNILDIGFGDGNILMLFKGNRIFGLETSQVAIEKFKKSINKRSFLGIELKESSNNKLPFLDKSMDIVILSHILEHVEDPNFLLQETRRILKDKGFLFLLLPINERFYKHPGHFSVWDRKKTYRILKTHKFDIKYYDENGNFEHITDLIMNIRNIFLVGPICSFIVNTFLSLLPFRMIFFEPISEVFGLKPRQLILIGSNDI